VVENIRRAAAKSLELMGADAANSVPIFTQMLSDTNKEIRGRAAVALWKIAKRTDGLSVMATNIWPPLLPGSSDPGRVVWEDQLNVLAEMGPAAKAAVPNLLRLCNHRQTPPIAPRALEILRKIDPEVAAGVILPQ
jgi:hypothetical protein